MEFFAAFILFFLALRMIVSLVNVLSIQHLPDKTPATFPKVSLLIPVRNEEATIGNLLSSIQKLDYPDFEVWICNDHSSDTTTKILTQFALEDTRFHWFDGENLPDNWIGKNFACHQLAKKASGKYLIFLDADVTLSIDSVSRAVSFFQEKKLSLLSVFPQQKLETFAAHITIPVMNWILQSLLPMKLVQTSKFPSLSAANGQFMMFDAENYRENSWHEKVRTRNVEDILLARMIKASGLKMAVLLGNRDIFCSMYEHWSEAILGFSRNIHQYFGGTKIVMFLFWFLIISEPFAVWNAFGVLGIIVFALMVIANRIFVSLACRQNIFKTILLHPLQMISFTAIVFYNLYRRKETEWKGRKIRFQD